MTGRPRRALLALLFALAVLVAGGRDARAAGTPAFTLTESSQSVLLGHAARVTLTVVNGSSEPRGYNLSYRAVLPAGVAFGANTDPNAPPPLVLTNEPVAGQTTVIWSNVADLATNSTTTFSFTAIHASGAFKPGDSFAITTGAFVNTGARYVPSFNSTGTPVSGAASFTGSASATGTTTISALGIVQTEGSSEGELLRGAHTHRTVYTVAVANNLINPTTGVVVDEWLPDDLEYLGCGTGDNTGDAPTNPGSPLEYPGAPALNAGGALAPGCLAPATLETVVADPDGAGPATTGVYTHLVYALGTLAPGATTSFSFVAAVPLRRNTVDWNGAAVGLGTAPAPGSQAANLDNNRGAETFDEESIPLLGTVDGLYQDPLQTLPQDAFASSLLTRTAEDLKIVKTRSSGSISQGQDTTWFLDLSTSEYRFVPSTTVTDTVPNGLCPVGPGSTDVDCVGPSGPSIPWDSAAEAVNGTWALVWTVPRTLAPDDAYEISFHTKTRFSYRADYAASTPILAGDSWSNTVHAAGAGERRCTGTDPVCGGPSPTEIDGDFLDGTTIADDSHAEQTASSPRILKGIQQTGTTVADCTTATYGHESQGSFAPGDRVCYRLTTTFPSVSTQSVSITDFLPPGATYVTGSAAAMPDDTLSDGAPTVDGGTYESWSPGAASTVDAAQVFDVVFAVTFGQAATIQDGQLAANLMKSSFTDSSGRGYSLRNEVDAPLAVPVVSLLNGVAGWNGNDYPADTDGVTVNGGSTTVFRVDVSNAGSAAAVNAEIWARLPVPLTCADVSDPRAGTCVVDAADGDYMRWTGITLPANSGVVTADQTTLMYGVSLPSSVAPGFPLRSVAGVRAYQGATNGGSAIDYYPAANIDPSIATVQSNVEAASDPTSISVISPTVSIGQTSSVTSESGNGATSQATIGETVTYTETAALQGDTTLYDSALVDTVPANVAYDGNTALIVGGVAAPPGWSVTYAAGPRTITVTPPAVYAVPAAGVTIVLSFDSHVTDTPSNIRGTTFADATALTWAGAAGGATMAVTASSAAMTVVQPAITASLTRTGPNVVLPGASVAYTMTFANPSATNASPAHDNTATVAIPTGLQLLNDAGTAAAVDGTTVAGGTYNAAAGTLTFAPADRNPSGAVTTPTFRVQVESSASSGKSYVVGLTGRTTSLAGASANERTSSSTTNTGYLVTSSNTLVISGAGLTKTVTPASLTIGDTATYTLTVTLAKNVNYYDTTVIDTLPAKLVYDGMYGSPTCTPSCSITATQLTATGTGPTTTGYFIGDVASGSVDRVVTITYRAHVATTAAEGTTLVNSATVYQNATDKLGTPTTIPPAAGFDPPTTTATKSITVHIPVPTLTKVATTAASGKIGPGETATYTLTVGNTGQWPLSNVHLTDRPSTSMTAVTLTGGAGFLTTAWAAPGDTMAFDIPGPIAPGGSVVITYTAKLIASSGLTRGQSIANVGTITQAFGEPAATRAANPTWFTTYGPLPATRTLTTDLPTMTVVQWTGAAGTVDSAAAAIDQPFTWRVIVTNTSSGAAANAVNISDALPADWTYVAGSAKVGGVAVADPTIAGQTLTWPSLIASLPAAGSKVLTFTATPSITTALNHGVGATHPYVANASVSWTDATGASAFQAGSYAAGPDPSTAILTNPTADMAVAKALTSGRLIEGQTVTYTLTATDNGPSYAIAANLSDTLPARLKPIAVDAPCTITGQVVACAWSSLASGDVRTIAVQAIVQPATTGPIANTATVSTTSTDAVSSNNTATASNPLERPTLGIVKSVAGQTGPGLIAGAQDALTYTLTLTNRGTADADNVDVTDLPATTLTGVVDTTAASGVSVTKAWSSGDHAMGWTVASVPAGGSVTITYTGTLSAASAYTDTQTVANTAVISGYYAADALTRAGNPTFPWTRLTDGGSSTATLTVHEPRLTIAQTTGLTGNPETGPAILNQSFPWRIVVHNNDATATAGSVTISDVLPAGWTYDTGTTRLDATAVADPTIASQTLTWTAVKTNLAGATDTILTFTATPGSQAALTTGIGATHPHTANATTSWQDPTGATADATAPFTAGPDPATATLTNPTADLGITKTLTAGHLTEGQTATYTLTVTNHGPNTALNATATDVLPTRLKPTAADAPCTITNQTVSCAWASMAAGDVNAVTIQAVVQPTTGGTIANHASVTTSSDDANAGDDAADTSDPVERPTLSIGKSVTGATGGGADAQPGDALTYTLSVANTGEATAFDVAVTDQPSSLLTNVIDVLGAASATTTWTPGAHSMAWTIPTIAAHATATLTYTADVVDGHLIADASAIDNTAAVPAYYQADAATRATAPTPGFAWTTLTDAGSASRHLAARVPLVTTTIAAATPGTSAVVNQPYGLAITAHNAGADATLSSATAVVTLPASWAYTAGSSDIGEPTINGQTLTFTLPAPIAAGATETGTFSATPSDDAALNPGVGPSHPHTFGLITTATDTSGDTTSADGPYRDADTLDIYLTNPTADLGTTISVDAPTAVEGDVLHYTVHLRNPGVNSALNVASITTLPDDVAFVGTVAGCSLTASTPRQQVTCTLAALRAGGSADRIITVRVRPAPASTLTADTVVTTTSEDATTSDDSATVDVAGQHPTLTLGKAVEGQSGPAGATQPGDTYTYSLTISNTGTSDAYDAVVTDTPPPELTNVVAVPLAGVVATGSWATAGDTLGWTVDRIPADTSVTITYTAALVSGAVLRGPQAIANTALIGGYYAVPTASRTTEPAYGWTRYADGGSSDTTLEAHVPTLTLTDTTGASGFPETAGAEILQPFAWRLVLADTDPTADAHAVSVVDTIPADWTYVAGTSTVDGTTIADPAVSGRTLTFSLATLAAGGDRTIDFQTRPGTAARTDPQPQTNSAVAAWTDGSGASSSADGAYVTGPDLATATLGFPALAITKTADAPTPSAGQTVTYTIAVTNEGTATARDLAITDAMPDGLAYAEGSATGTPAAAETDGTAPSLAWSLASLAAGDSVTITVPLVVATDVDPATVLDNTASVTSDERPDPSTATSRVTTTASADLSLEKTGPVARKAGQTVVWSLHAANAGPSDARAVVLTDPLPANVTFVSASAGCSASVGTVTCGLGTIAAGSSATATITARIVPGTLDPVVNTATVASSTADPDPSNDTSTETVVIGNEVDLGIMNKAADAHIPQGGETTFTLKVRNDVGPSDAHVSHLTDTFPAGLSILSATTSQGTCAVLDQVVSCAFGDVLYGSEITVTVRVRGDVVGPQAAAAAIFTAPDADVDPSNDTAAASVIVDPVAELAVTKTGPATLAALGTASYALTATNAGPSDATGVVLTDQIPVGTTVAGASEGCVLSGQTLSCPVGALAVGAGATRTVDLTMAPGLSGLPVEDTANVSGNELDLDPSDDASSVTTQVGALPVAPASAGSPGPNLRIVKRATALLAGSGVTYTLAVTNVGATAATGVVVIDPLPAGVGYRSSLASQGACTATGSLVTCSLGAIPAGAAATVDVVGRVAAGVRAGTTISNTASVDSDAPDQDASDNSSTASGVVSAFTGAANDVRLVKTVSSTRPAMADAFTYTLWVRNLGRGVARNVSIVDPVPSGLQIVSVHADRGSCVVTGLLVDCSVGSLAAGVATSVTVTVRALRLGGFRNLAMASSNGTDTNIGNNVMGVAATVVRVRGRLSITKRAARKSVGAGRTVDFTIVVTARFATVAGVSVCDLLPRGMVLVSAPGSKLRAGHACWVIPYLDIGRRTTLRVRARALVASSGRLTNAVTAVAPNVVLASARASVRVRATHGLAPASPTGRFVD